MRESKKDRGDWVLLASGQAPLSFLPRSPFKVCHIWGERREELGLPACRVAATACRYKVALFIGVERGVEERGAKVLTA